MTSEIRSAQAIARYLGGFNNGVSREMVLRFNKTPDLDVPDSVLFPAEQFYQTGGKWKMTAAARAKYIAPVEMR